MDYLAGLELQEPDRKLYLAVSENGYKKILANPLAKVSLNRYKVCVIVFNHFTNTISKWID